MKCDFNWPKRLNVASQRIPNRSHASSACLVASPTPVLSSLLLVCCFSLFVWFSVRVRRCVWLFGVLRCVQSIGGEANGLARKKKRKKSRLESSHNKEREEKTRQDNEARRTPRVCTLLPLPLPPTLPAAVAMSREDALATPPAATLLMPRAHMRKGAKGNEVNTNRQISYDVFLSFSSSRCPSPSFLIVCAPHLSVCVLLGRIL